MKMHTCRNQHQCCRPRICRWSLLGPLAVCCLSPGVSNGVEIQGFLEPYRTVNVAAPETGIITKIYARVGDEVKKGDVIVQLDDDVHRLLVESAAAKMAAQGRLESAKAELRLRQYRLSKLRELIERGHGRQEEVERGAADVEIAAAQVLDAKDDLLFKTLEHRRLKVQLERREIRSPLDGFVSLNLKEVGEFVAPNDPDVVTVVQLDPLLAKFSMRRSHAKSVTLRQTVTVGFPLDANKLEGIVEEISPVIDAESGTVRIRVRVENSEGTYDSGQRCTLHLPDMVVRPDETVKPRELAADQRRSELPGAHSFGGTTSAEAR